MTKQEYTKEFQNQIRIQAPANYKFWEHQSTFALEQLDEIVEHGMGEEFTPQQLASRLYEIVLYI